MSQARDADAMRNHPGACLLPSPIVRKCWFLTWFRYAHEQTRFQRGNFPLLVFFSFVLASRINWFDTWTWTKHNSLQSNGGLHFGFRLMDRSGGVHSGPIRKPSVSGSNSRKSLANFITVSREISRRRYGSSRNWGQMSKSCQSGHGTLAHTLGRLAQQRHTINAEKRGSTARQAVTTLSERQCNGLVGARRKLLRKIE